MRNVWSQNEISFHVVWEGEAVHATLHALLLAKSNYVCQRLTQASFCSSFLLLNQMVFGLRDLGLNSRIFVQWNSPSTF